MYQYIHVVLTKLILKKIDILKKYFDQIGFSDHTENIYASVLALKYEPLFIENILQLVKITW